MDRTPQIEAFKALGEWSKWLVGLNAGILGLLVFGVKTARNESTNCFLAGAVVFLTISLLIATWLVGAVPPFIQCLMSENVGKSALIGRSVKCDGDNIYGFRYGRIPILLFAFFQHAAFVLGIVFLAIALCIWILGPVKG